MAKLKGPLFSLGATQQLGKALVFFPWKGLNVVREYVVPSNPRSTDQQAQRAHLTAAVLRIHQNMGKALLPLDEVDIRAYALWASVVKPATTWFNQAVKNCIDQLVAGDKHSIYRTGDSTPQNTALDVHIRNDYFHAAHIVTGRFHWGTSKTALINVQAAVMDLPTNEATATIPNLTNGTKYFWQFRPLTLAAYVGSWSGIYHGTPAA